MKLTAMLPQRRTPAERARRQGVRLVETGKDEVARHPRAAAAAGAGAVGAAAMAIAKLRRSHGNGAQPAAEEPGGHGMAGAKPRVHTTPEEGHPAGTGERSDRDIGGPATGQ